MRNLEISSKKKEKISNQDMMFMVRMISLEFNRTFSSQEMADKISEIFHIDCTKKDVERFEENYRQYEDFELESRKIQEYGSSIRY